MARRRRLEEQPTKTAAKAVRAPKRMRATELALEPSMVTAPARMSPPPTLSVPITPDLPWVARYPARIQLGLFPTPIEKLERLSRELGGPEIYVKRDDQTGLATGGNKSRKLEFLMADARESGCNHVVTLGGPQSNHVRQTAAAAAR